MASRTSNPTLSDATFSKRATTAMLVGIVAIAAAAAPIPQTAAPAPISGAELMRRVAHAYASCRTYRDSGLKRVHFVGSHTNQFPFKTAFVRPDRFRFEYGERSRFHDGGREVFWRGDGKVMTWSPSESAASEGRSLDAELGVAVGISNGTSHTIPTLLMPDEITGARLTELPIEQEPELAVLEGVDCWRIGLRANRGIETVWIDARRLLVLRIEDRFGLGSSSIEETTTLDAAFDEELAPSLLALSPPERERQRPEAGALLLLLLPLLGVLFGLSIVAIGSVGLAIGRPYVVTSRWFLPSLLLLAALEPLPHVVDYFSRLTRGIEEPGIGSALRLGFVVVPVFFAWFVHSRALPSYSIFGTTEPVLSDALVSTLRVLGIEHELKRRIVRLRGAGAEIELVGGAWIGMLRLKAKRRADVGVLRQVADGMRVCFRSGIVPVDRWTCVKSIVSGLVIVAIAVVSVIALRNLN